MKKALILAFVMFVFPLPAGAKDKGSSNEELFSLANLVYLDGKYEEAIESYKAIEKNGIVNPDVYYNIGNTYARMGELGRARLYYEKSLELGTGSEDARYNLGAVKEGLSISAEELDLRPPWQRLLDSLTFKGCADFTLFVYFATCIALLTLILSRSEFMREKAKKGSLLLILITFAAAALTLFKASQQEGGRYGVIIAKGAGIYEAPIGGRQPIGSVGEGIKVRILAAGNGRVKILVPSNMSGWVGEAYIEAI